LYWKLPVYPWNACIFPIALLFLKIVLKIPLRLPSNVKGHYYEYLNVDFHTFKEDLILEKAKRLLESVFSVIGQI
jgi:hypothetical protein